MNIGITQYSYQQGDSIMKSFITYTLLLTGLAASSLIHAEITSKSGKPQDTSYCQILGDNKAGCSDEKCKCFVKDEKKSSTPPASPTTKNQPK